MSTDEHHNTEEPQIGNKKKRSLVDLTPRQAVIAVFLGVVIIAVGEILISLLWEMLF